MSDARLLKTCIGCAPSRVLLPLLALLAVIALSFLAAAAPQGTQISYNYTETAPVIAAASSTTQGGSFTTLILNTTTQTPRWKAYVGNVTGRFTLDDAENNTIYDWSATSFTGEVFASRSGDVSWGDIRCARNTTIIAEHVALNMTALMVDNINKTFNETVHAEFYVGAKHFAESGCPAIATYVNDAPQSSGVNADFQEVLLDDTSNLVFAGLLEFAKAGFDDGEYNFQMIVPESDVQSTPQTYYFYTELG